MLTEDISTAAETVYSTSTNTTTVNLKVNGFNCIAAFVLRIKPGRHQRATH